ncbi:hypothetical protein N9V86_02590 [Opitutales bacterium]|nr:hypothetical protein [Opitutales bacterium]
MSRYTTYGPNDDPIQEDLDVGFIGFNSYARPDQLPAGMLANSSNGRLSKNGEWQVRPGIGFIKAPFASGDDVLRLPTTAESTAIPPVVGLLPTTIRSASLVSNEVLIVIDDPAVGPGHVFVAGDEIYVENLVSTTTDPNGLHTLTLVTDNGDTKTLTYALTGPDETYSTPLNLPFALDDGGSEPQLTVLTASSVIGYNMILDQGAVSQVYTSATFSDPNQDNNQFIVLASNVSAVATDLQNTSTSITMAYPLGENVPPASSMLQAFNRLFIFRDGQTALENDKFFSPIAIASASTPAASNVVTVNTSADHGLVIGDAITIAGLTGFPTGEDPNGCWVINTVPSSTSFTYDLPAVYQAAATYTVDATSTISPGFKLVASGEYEQPKQLSPTKVLIENGKATADFPSLAAINGTEVGDVIEIENAGGSTFTVGTDYVISSVDKTLFELEFYVQEPDNIPGGASGVIFQRHVSVGLGFTHMPAPEYAAYHQRRLVMPFKYSVDNTENTFTYRAILDEVIVSDILDSDTYDQIYAQYRFNAGTADFNVGLHSFSDDKLLVFNRNSIHLVSGAGLDSTVQLITNEVGCVARNSIIQVGNNVLFLSDNGVYGANFQDLYNLRGNEVPLSSPIDPVIKRINRAVWDKSVGVYFDNRYYLAVPLDGSQVNNAILIFNFINKQWESIDTTEDVNWNIANLIVAGKKADRAVYAVNTLGGLHKLDARVDAVDLLATEIPVGGQEETVAHDIPASVTTRQFTLGTIDRKRWNNFELHVQSSPDNASDLSISAELENIDSTVDLGTLNSLNSNTNLAPDEDVSVRGRIGNKRAYGMQVTLNNTVGRPRFRAIKVAGAEAFRSTNKAI